MSFLAKYMLSIICAAIICGILKDIVKTAKTGKIINLLCSVFLTVTVLRPLTGLTPFQLTIPDLSAVSQGKEAAAQGEQIMQSAIADIIKSESEAYILDKAAELNAEIQVEIKLSADNPPIPESVWITGSIAPSDQIRLRNIIESDLGIPKENQLWNGEPSLSRENST